MLIFRHLREAELALGEGDEDARPSALDAIAEPLIAITAEPQWIGVYGVAAGRAAPRAAAISAAPARGRAGAWIGSRCAPTT